MMSYCKTYIRVQNYYYLYIKCVYFLYNYLFKIMSKFVSHFLVQ